MSKYLILIIFFFWFRIGYTQISFLLDSAVTPFNFKATFSNAAIYIYNNSYTGNNTYLAKTDYFGNVIWSRSNPFDKMIEADGALYGIRKDSVIKMDTSGNLKWIKRFSIPICSSNALPNVFDEIVFDGSQIYLHELQGDGNNSSLLPVTMILDTGGNVISTRCDSMYVSQSSNYRHAPGCASSIGGAIFSYGYQGGNYFYSYSQRENSNGTLDQSSLFPVFHSGENDYIKQIIQSADGNYFILSTTENNQPVQGIAGLFTVTKVDESGNIIWKFCGTDSVSGSPANYKFTNAVSITTDDSSQVYLLGYASIFSVYGGQITTKIDNNGNVLFTKLWKYPTTPVGFGNLQFHNDKIYSVGIFQNKPAVIVFDTLFNISCLAADSSISMINYPTLQGPGALIRTSYNVSYLPVNDPMSSNFLNIGTQNFCSALYIENIFESFEISVVPNPGSGKFRFDLNLEDQNVELRIYNAMGGIISIENKKEIDGIQIDLSNHPSGIYFVQAYSGGKLWKGKVLKY